MNTTTGGSFFHRELARLGPTQPPTAWSLRDAAAYCREWTRQSSENFTVVSWLLPRRVRQDFYNIYAYCRWSDDLADEVADPANSLRLLDWWQQQLALCYSGRPAHPILVALQQTIQRYDLPMELFTDLLRAFRQDQQQSRYANEPQLIDYCRRSANPVGRILLRVADCDNELNQRLSDSICTGLQLANFCQDMARDAAANRIYAPQTLWAQHDVDEAMLLRGQVTRELRQMLQSWVVVTRDYFEAGWPLIARAPGWFATDLELFARGGLAVLQAIERQQYDVWTARPRISRTHKARLFAGSVVGRYFGRRITANRALREEPADAS